MFSACRVDETLSTHLDTRRVPARCEACRTTRNAAPGVREIATPAPSPCFPCHCQQCISRAAHQHETDNKMRTSKTDDAGQMMSRATEGDNEQAKNCENSSGKGDEASSLSSSALCGLEHPSRHLVLHGRSKIAANEPDSYAHPTNSPYTK